MPAILWGLLAALLLNSAFLAAFPSPTIFFYANVGLHVGLGVVVSLAAMLSVVRRWRRLDDLLRVGALILFACAAVGVWVAIVGASRAYARVLYAHVGLAAAGVLVLAAWLDGRKATGGAWLDRPHVSTAGVMLLSLAVGAPIAIRTIAKGRWEQAYRITNPVNPPLSMNAEGGGPSSPFFPSSARTNVGGTIPANFFMTSATCGRCHKDIYDQ